MHAQEGVEKFPTYLPISYKHRNYLGLIFMILKLSQEGGKYERGIEKEPGYQNTDSEWEQESMLNFSVLKRFVHLKM